MNSGLLLSDDLLFISRVTGTARSLGLDMQSARSAADLLAKARVQAPACVVIDLHNPGLDIGALVGQLQVAGKPFIVAYGSHVEAATLQSARDAGCALVLPRSKFVADLAAAMPKWFSKDAT